MKRFLPVVVLLLIIIAGVFFYTNSNRNLSSLNNNQEPIGGGPGITDTQNAKDYVITSKSYRFTPDTITVNKGDKIRLTLNNTENVHDLKIDDFGVQTKKLQAGQSDTVEFTADKTGTFEFYCSIDGHRQMGMVGKLIVQ